jgi:endoglucanase
MSKDLHVKRTYFASLLFALAITCAGCGTGSVASSVLAGQVSIVNNKLMRDGKPWTPHGYFQVAFQASPNEQNVPAFETNAQMGYTPQEYTDMANAGADSVRVMLGQTVGDRQNSMYYSQAFVNQFIGAVQAARNAGLTVIVGIQDESITQDQNPTDLPNAATQRVWSQLIPAFKEDKGILLELFNEPGTAPAVGSTPLPNPTPTTAEWQAWATAMNSTIASVRSEGATNVVVADGLTHATTLTGAPTLTDNLNEVAYAAHPYTFQASSEQQENAQSFLDNSFGNFAANNPVIITEWGQGYYCGPTNPDFLITFLNYIQSKGIGLEMSFWDWGGPTAFGGTQYGFPKDTQVSMYYSNGSLVPCETNNSPTPARGPGLTINSWYSTGVIPGAAL